MSVRISVIVPCYRQAHLVGDAVRSVLELDQADAFEVIVVDDGSPDDVSAAVTPWGDRVRLICQDNRGLSGARNTGIAAATGEYVMFLDADDVAHFELGDVPDRLAGWDACLGDYLIEMQWNGNTTRHHANADGGAAGLFRRNLGPVQSCIVRRELALAVGGFDVSLRSCEDWDFWIRLWRTEPKSQNVNRAYGVYRLYESSMVTDYARMWRSARAVWRKHRDLGNGRRQDYAGFYRFALHDRVCGAYAKCGSTSEKCRFWGRLLTQSPSTFAFFLKSRLHKG